MRWIEARDATVVALSLALSISAASTTPAASAVMTFTNSAAFTAAATNIPLTVENYSTGVAGETIASGGAFHGLTYTFSAGPSGTLLGGIITNQFNSFSGLSLGGNQSGGAQFFFGGDSFTLTFPTPINAIDAFFNVNQNSGNYTLGTAVGSVSTGSTTYDTSTFVFDGLISTTPFTTATFSSTDTSLGSFNIPEIEFGAARAQAVPEPSSLALVCAALAAGSLTLRRRRSFRG
jgi:hypothetical protein